MTIRAGRRLIDVRRIPIPSRQPMVAAGRELIDSGVRRFDARQDTEESWLLGGRSGRVAAPQKGVCPSMQFVAEALISTAFCPARGLP